MGYKILYDFLKRNKRIYVYEGKWQDYLPSNIEKIMEAHKENEKFEIYYNRRRHELYRIGGDITTKAKYYIEIIKKEDVKKLILNNNIYNNLPDNWKRKLGFKKI